MRDLAQAIINPSLRSEQELEQSVAGHEGPEIVRALLDWPGGQVRFWALGKAEHVLNRAEYLHELRKASDDSDEAVSSEAIGRLAVLDPGFMRQRARSLSAKLKQDVRSGQKIFAIWSLCRIGSKEAIGAIDELRNREPAWTKLARAADVAIRYLTEGAEGILSDIRHQRAPQHMEELCTVAWFVMADENARNALEHCATSAVDGRWKRECTYGLTRFGDR